MNIQDLLLSDSGATKHISFRREWFDSLTSVNGEQILFGDNSVKDVVGIGSIKIKRLVHGNWVDRRLNDVLYVPDFKKNLFSMNVCTKIGIRATYEDDRVILQMKNTNEIVAEGIKYHSDICCLYFKFVQPESNYSEASLQSMHERLGHVNKTMLRKMIQHKAIDGIEVVDDRDFFCEGCVFGKMHRLPCKSNGQGLIFGNCMTDIECVMNALKSEFEIIIGSAEVFVGIEIERNRKDKIIFLHQESYANKIINRFNMSLAYSCNTPADPKISLSVPSKSCDINVPYRELIGSLMFLSVVTRPDLSFIVNYLGRFVNNYDYTHWEASKRVLKYLKSRSCLGIMYKGNVSNELCIHAYSDSNFAGDKEVRKSISGGIIQISSEPVIWFSRKQSIIAQSTTEAEYVAASMITKEIVWVKRLLDEIGHKIEKPINLNVDNLSAIQLANHPTLSRSTKHIEVKFHFVRDKVDSK